jgi:hypothetical protein
MAGKRKLAFAKLGEHMRIVLFTTCDNFVGGSLTSYAGIDALLSKPEGGWKMIEWVHSLLKAE